MIDLDTLFNHLFESTQFLDVNDQNEVMQKFADKLIEWHGVTYDQIRDAMSKVDMVLEVKCLTCNDHMPNFTNGTPVCSDCGSDSEMSM